jgi:hypothetical protein
MTGIDIVNTLIPKLLDMDLIVHRYDAYSTNSIYLKLDYGIACGIRIADHPGKKKYSYRFNIIKDFKGDKVILKDGLICNFYDFTELEKVLKDVQEEKKKKLYRYGINNYNSYVEREKNKNELFKRFKKV